MVAWPHGLSRLKPQRASHLISLSGMLSPKLSGSQLSSSGMTYPHAW